MYDKSLVLGNIKNIDDDATIVYVHLMYIIYLSWWVIVQKCYVKCCDYDMLKLVIIKRLNFL